MSTRIAFVVDALPGMGGAERVLCAALEAYPQTPIYSLFYNPEAFAGTAIARQPVHTSYLNRLPGAERSYRRYLPLMPAAVESFDLRGYEVVVSFSYAVAHGALASPGQAHLCYIHTPMRYAWQSFHEYFGGRGVLQWAARRYLHYFRLWDLAASQRVDHYAAVSSWTAECVRRAYRRDASVIYPPVEVERLRPLDGRGAYYITVSRLVGHKRVDLIVEAFTRLGLPLVVVGDGPQRRRLLKKAGPNVRLAGRLPDEQVAELLGRAKAFVHAAEEDFGIAMVEAQAAGCPVIAFGRGGAREIVTEGLTGTFFDQPTVESLVEAVERFEREKTVYPVDVLRASSERFSKQRFLEQFMRLVEWARQVDAERLPGWFVEHRVRLAG